MLQRVIRGGLRKVISSLALILVFVLLLLGLARILSPFAGQSRYFVQKMTAHIFHHPVHIAKVSVRWFGFEPVASLQGVTIYSEKNHQPLLKINRFKFGLNLWQSVLHGNLLPDHLEMSGVNLTLAETKHHRWQLLGIGNILKNEKENSYTIDMQQMFYWLATQSTVRIKNVEAALEDTHGNAMWLRQVKLQAEDQRHQRQIIGSGVIQDKKTLKSNGYPFRFTITPKKEEQGPKAFGADFALQLAKVNFNTWWNQQLISHFLPKYRMDHGTLSAHFQGQVRKGGLQMLSGQLRGSHLQLTNPKVQKKLQLKYFNGQLSWLRRNSGWDFALTHLNITDKDHRWRLHRADVNYSAQGNNPGYQISLDALSMQDVIHASVLSGLVTKKIAVWEQRLAPVGSLEHIKVSFPARENAFVDGATLETNFHLDRVNAYQFIPGIKHFSGHVSVMPKRSKAQAWQWQFPAIQLTNGNLQYFGKAALNLPLAGAPRLSLQGRFSANNVGALSSYVPKQIISPQLQQWLRAAFVGGVVKHGQVSFQGPLVGNKAKFQLSLAVQDVNLHYAKHWPDLHHINAELQFDRHSMHVFGSSATIAGNFLKNIKVGVKDLAHAVITLQGEVISRIPASLQFLRQSPLELGEIGKSWRGDGLIRMNLFLSKNLQTDHSEMQAKGRIHFANDKLQFIPHFQPVTGITGDLEFNNNVLSAQKIVARFLGQPMLIRASTHVLSANHPEVQFNISSHMLVSSLKKIMPLPILGYMKGQFPYQGMVRFVDIGNGRLQGGLRISTDFQGLSAKLPPPFGKHSVEARSSFFDMKFSADHKVILHYQYAQLLSLYAEYLQTGNFFELQNGELRLGKGTAMRQSHPGLFVDGYLPMVDWQQWSQFIKPYIKQIDATKPKHSILAKLRAVQLEVRKIKVMQTTFGNTYFSLLPEKQGWYLGVQNDVVTGNVLIPNQQMLPWRIHLIKANLQLDKGKPLALEFSKHPFEPNRLPAIDFSCRSCQWNKNYLGAVQLETHKIKYGIHIDDLKVRNPMYTMDVRGRWTNHNNKEMTSVYGYLSNQKLGSFLQSWGMTDVVVNGVGETLFSLNWPGLPFKPNWGQASGNVHFNYARGRIVKLSPKTSQKIDLGRILNLLSLQSLPQTLLSGFSHLGVKGFEFSRFKGHMAISNGIGYTDDVALTGPVAWVRIKGGMNFDLQQYDFNMRVIPDVTSSLPLIVGIAGGPLAGVLTWVADKLLASKIGEVAASDYNIRGSMDHPVISKINRIRQK